MKNLKDIDIEVLKFEISRREEEAIREAKRKKEAERNHARMIRIKRRFSFSEILILSVLLGGYIILGVASLYSWVNLSDSVWMEILDVLKVLLPISIGFFSWKARGENLVKIKNNPNFNVEDIANDAISAYMNSTKDDIENSN